LGFGGGLITQTHVRHNQEKNETMNFIKNILFILGLAAFSYMLKLIFLPDTTIPFIVYILAPIFILKIFNFIRVMLTRKPNLGTIESAEKYVKELSEKDEKEFCLILRPFGRDGYLPMKSLNKGSEYQSLIKNWEKGITTEEVIETVVKHQFPNLETIALVNPDLLMIPTSPKYIASKHDNWRWVVYELLKRTVFLFIIIPPKQEVRDSLIWEVTKAVQLGLLGRLVLILPPMKDEERKSALKDVKEKLFFLSPLLEDIPDDTVMFHPNYDDEIFYWHLGEKVKQIDFLNYVIFIEQTVKRMKREIKNLNYIERHPNIEKEYSDFDYNMSTSQLSYFLKRLNNPFSLKN